MGGQDRPGADEHADVPRGGLQRGRDEHERGAEHDGGAPAEGVDDERGEGERGEGADVLHNRTSA